MKVDIVILSHGKTPELRGTTQNAINSCLSSESEIEFNIIVIEQEDTATYTRCQVYYDYDDFNYNRSMNRGIELGDAQYICLCNNDLIFYPNWCSILIDAMQKHELLSACPICPHVQKHRLSLKEEIYFGYRNSHEVSGWCIMINRDILKIIGKLDEEFPFWFADNVYSEQLKRHNIKHACVTKSVVEHLGSKTLNTLPQKEKDAITTNEAQRFVLRHPRNESAVYFKDRL
jgi:GT2 family glycosyltransferase